MTNVNGSVDSWSTRKNLHGTVFERMKESKWGMLKGLIKIKITRHRAIDDECICDGLSLMNACWVSQRCPIKFQMQSVMVCFKKYVYRRNNISLKKDTEKDVLLQM